MTFLNVCEASTTSDTISFLRFPANYFILLSHQKEKANVRIENSSSQYREKSIFVIVEISCGTPGWHINKQHIEGEAEGS